MWEMSAGNLWISCVHRESVQWFPHAMLQTASKQYKQMVVTGLSRAVCEGGQWRKCGRTWTNERLNESGTKHEQLAPDGGQTYCPGPSESWSIGRAPDTFGTGQFFRWIFFYQRGTGVSGIFSGYNTNLMRKAFKNIGFKDFCILIINLIAIYIIIKCTSDSLLGEGPAGRPHFPFL